MKRNDLYLDLEGNEISLANLDADERRLITQLRRRADGKPDWIDFDNFAFHAVMDLYNAKGTPRKEVKQSVPFQIALDLSARLGISQRMIRAPDYLDQLEDLVLNHFPSRRAFCKATGLSDSMLSHVLAGRKDLSMAALTKALARIGYQLRITPGQRRRTG
jgi:hypothetical protein